MKTNQPRSALPETSPELEDEWMELADLLKDVPLPGFSGKRHDLINYRFLRPLLRDAPELLRSLDPRTQELLSQHPLLTLSTGVLDTFSPAAPYISSEKYLEFNYASFVNPMFYHSDTGAVVFHSDLMGNLGADCPGVALTYKFPDDRSVSSYEVVFKLWMYDRTFTAGTGADFRLVSSEVDAAYGVPVGPVSTRGQHLDLPDSNFMYLRFGAPASRVNGKTFRFTIQHFDWLNSPINWWFYSATVSKRYLG